MNENDPTPPSSAEQPVDPTPVVMSSEPTPEPASPNTTPPNSPAPGMDANQWAMLLHLSQLAVFVVPGLGLAAPIVIWQLKKAEFPAIDTHGIMVTNWIISVLIYSAVVSAVAVVTCGFGSLLFLPILAVAVAFPIIGGLKARDGVLWNYPLTIKIIK